MSELKMADQPIELYMGKRGPIDGPEACKTAAALAGGAGGPGGQPLYILAYTPDFCGFATLSDDGKLAALEGPRPGNKGKFKAEDVFELRCFCEAFELRWAYGDGSKKAVVLSESRERLEGLDGFEVSPIERAYKRPGRYVLWGKGVNRGGGVRLFDHRVGELPLPDGVEVPAKGWVLLNFDEYFTEDDYGNLRWRSERLRGFSPLGPEAVTPEAEALT